LASTALGQQDPDDPGLPDSLILSSVHVDSGAMFVIMPITVVTDDSVGFYNIPLAWHAPFGGVRGGAGTQYFPPLTSWDLRYDSVLFSESYYRMFGIYSLGMDSLIPPLYTDSLRLRVINLRFLIDPGTPRQLVVIDTTNDPRNGSLMFGLVDGLTGFVPSFRPGFISIGEPIGVDDPDLGPPKQFSLSQNYPNPFNPSTNIAFTLPSEGIVSLVILDLLGREVRTLLDERFRAGSYTVAWNGKDNSGFDVPSGTYFYRLATEGFAETRRMTLVR